MSAIQRDEPQLAAPRADGSAVSDSQSTQSVRIGSRPARGVLRLRGGWRWASPLAVLVIWQLTHVFKLISEAEAAAADTRGDDRLEPDRPPDARLREPPGSAGRCHSSASRSASRRRHRGDRCSRSPPASAASVRLTFDPLVQMIRTLPLFGLIPVFIVWFGIGQLPKVLLVALAAAVPLYLNTYAGIRSIDGRLYELGRVLGLTRRETADELVLPGAMPQALVGLRQSLGAAWLVAGRGRADQCQRGPRFHDQPGREFLRNDVIFVALIVYTLLGLLTDWIVRMLERRALAWRTDLVIA